MSHPRAIPATDLLAFDQLALASLPEGFEALDLSPVLPLGGHGALAPVHQDRVLTTVRGTEVAADPTNALALECAVRRKALLASSPRSAKPVRLAASQRQLRCQTFEGPATVAHFRLLALCTSGRDEGDLRFETRAMVEHLGFYLGLLSAVRSLKLHADRPRVIVQALDPTQLPRLRDRVVDVLAPRFPDASFELGTMDGGPTGYFSVTRATIHATPPAGEELHLVDCGFTDWTQKLLASRKERLCTSGIGTERLWMAFRAP